MFDDLMSLSTSSLPFSTPSPPPSSPSHTPPILYSLPSSLPPPTLLFYTPYPPPYLHIPSCSTHSLPSSLPSHTLLFYTPSYPPSPLQSPNNATVEVCLTNAHNDPPYFIGCPYDWTIAENDNTPLSGQILATSEDTSVLGQLTYSLSVPPPIPSAWFTIPNPSVSH